MRGAHVTFLDHIWLTDATFRGGGAIVNRTYDTHKNLYIYLFLLTMFGPIYYGPP